MAMTIDDKQFLVDLATIMMRHIAWLINSGTSANPMHDHGAQAFWHSALCQGFKEETTKLLLKERE